MTLGGLRRTGGRVSVAIRSAGRTLAIYWRDADRIDRLQVLGASALVVGVFAVFAIGAATRSDEDVADLPSAGLSPGPPSRAAGGGRGGDGEGAAAGSDVGRGGLAGLAGSGSGPGSAGTPDGGRGDGDEPDSDGTPGRPGDDATPGNPAGGSTPVVIGVAYRASSAAAALAGTLRLAEPPGDVPRQARAVADWVNAHGGVAGRPLELRLAGFDPAVASSYPSAFSAACSAVAAGDQRPVAVVGAIDDAPAQAGCLAGRGITLVGDGPAAGDRHLFDAAGAHLFAPGSMGVDRLAGAQARILLDDGFIDRRSRVGIVRLDGPIFDRAARLAIRPALEAAGVTVAADEVLPHARALTDLPSSLARTTAAVLRLRAAGVDRVLMLEAGIVAAGFMREAERQGFRPRYALNSTMAPAGLPGEVPAAQLRGSQGIGFAPLLDVAGGDEPAAPERRGRCEEIYRAAQVPTGGRTAAGQFAAVALCDAILTLQAAVESAQGTGAAEIAAAIERIGASRPAAVALGTRLAPDRHDGAAEVRRVRFDDRCGCMRYAGAGEPVP